MKKTFLFILFAVFTLFNYSIACSQLTEYQNNPTYYNNPTLNNNPTFNNNPAFNNNPSFNNSPAFNNNPTYSPTNTFAPVIKFEDRRDLPGFPMAFTGNGLNFYYDPSQSPDSTIIGLKELETVLVDEIKTLDYERGKRLSSSEVTMVDQLFASMFNKTKSMTFVRKENVDPNWVFIGYATPKTNGGKAGSFNLAGNITVFGNDNGANRAVLETSGYRRGGESSQAGIGAAGGLSMIFESAKNAFGPAFNLFPSYSKAESAPIDNAHARFKLYVDLSDPDTMAHQKVK